MENIITLYAGDLENFITGNGAVSVSDDIIITETARYCSELERALNAEFDNIQFRVESSPHIIQTLVDGLPGANCEHWRRIQDIEARVSERFWG